MCWKAGEGGGVGMDGELATPAGGFVERNMVLVMEGFQEEEDVSVTLTSWSEVLPGKYHTAVWNSERCVWQRVLV